MDLLTLLDKLEEIVTNARRVPLTDRVVLEPDEIFTVIDQLRESVPSEIKEARWIVKEKQQHLQEAEKEAQRILNEAKEKAQRLASESEIVKEAQRQAQEIIDSAKAKEREIRLAAEDYADEVFANLEANLSKLLAAVQRGRDRLQTRVTSRE